MLGFFTPKRGLSDVFQQKMHKIVKNFCMICPFMQIIQISGFLWIKVCAKCQLTKCATYGIIEGSARPRVLTRRLFHQKFSTFLCIFSKNLMLENFRHNAQKRRTFSGLAFCTKMISRQKSDTR